MVVDASKAAPSPRIGQALGSLGVNMMQFCKKFNAQTTNYVPGIPLRVKLNAYKDGSFTIDTKAPTTSWFLKKAAGVDKCANQPGHETVGKVHVKQIYEIAKVKMKELDDPRISHQGMCRTIAANCRTMGLKVDGTKGKV